MIIMNNTIYSANAPIGIFDSGIGGLTVARALADALPNEHFIYIGDTAHLPYGLKSTEAILEYCMGISQYLYESGCKMIIIACNTASAAAYEKLKAYWQGRMFVVDVITPLVEFITSQSYAKIGVIATKSTIRSDIYAQKITSLNPKMEVVSLATSLLAQIIEEGFYCNQISKAVINQYLSYPDFEEIEALLLACTHYPLIKPEIEAYFGERVAIYDSIQPVINIVHQILQTHQLFRTALMPNKRAQYQFLVSDYTQSFQHVTRIFYQQDIPLQKVTWEGKRLVLEQ